MLLTYGNCNIAVLQSTDDPNWFIDKACAITQKQNTHNSLNTEPGKLIKYLLTANHTSVFEHCFITVLITNVSRSFLAQITRHRMGSFTSASQHYQEYNEYPNIVHPDMDDSDTKNFFAMADKYYERLISEGIPKEEARQVLPNAKAVNIMWTVNARSLVNFLNLRMCKRNVAEMLWFANRMSYIATQWWPELFTLVGPDCFMKGQCFQGVMSCGKNK